MAVPGWTIEPWELARDNSILSSLVSLRPRWACWTAEDRPPMLNSWWYSLDLGGGHRSRRDEVERMIKQRHFWMMKMLGIQ